ncbi:MAG: AbrB/MazE/SpoVT family DNA-binding domain-containing protein [Candidatus Diapherotrites archaeon]|nr:AbrB/MazE/SpoVT family DNA-binding domain-containing protein [Candidatus Diapherotrites archaeon]
MEKQVNCHLCGAKAELKFEDVSLVNGRVLIKDSPYFHCIKCGKDFSTSEQMKELSGLISSQSGNFSFQRKIINAGRSLAITFPADIVEAYSLKKGAKIKLIPENNWTITLKV